MPWTLGHRPASLAARQLRDLLTGVPAAAARSLWPGVTTGQGHCAPEVDSELARANPWWLALPDIAAS